MTFILTGLMAIGFMSFGGMLTGGDEAPAKENVAEVVAPQEVEEIEVAVDSTQVEVAVDTLTQIVE